MTINAHPQLPEFEYIRPGTLMEASQFLAQHASEARTLSGGTDIFVRMRNGFWRDKYLVDIKHLDGMGDISFDPEAGLTIGAAVNMNRAHAYPAVQEYYHLLGDACRSVASYQLRTRATIIGNLCNASPAGDTIGACLVFNGILKVHGVNGFRDMPLAKFFIGPGKTALQPGDIVTVLHLPLPPEGSAGTYIKLGRNTRSDLAIVGVTVFGFPDTTATSGYSFRIALTSVAPIPLVASAAQDYLATTFITPEAFSKAAKLVAEACNPVDDVRASARYRRAMAHQLTEKALQEIWTRLSR